MDLITTIRYLPDAEFYEAVYGLTLWAMQQQLDGAGRDEPVREVLVRVDQPMDVQEFRTLAGSEDLRVIQKMVV